MISVGVSGAAGRMGRLVAETIAAAEDLELRGARADAVALLALVAGQDVEPGDGPGRWRIARRTAPDRVVSMVDPESRHVHKTRESYRDGHKAHIAADTGIITAVDLTAGNVADAPQHRTWSSTPQPTPRSRGTRPTARVGSGLTSTTGASGR